MTNTTTASTGNQNDNYYNDAYSGIGWVNSIRVHQAQGKHPFIALDLHVKQGAKQPKDGEKVRTLRISTIARGSQAAAMASSLLEMIDFDKSVKSDNNPEGRPVVSARFVAGSLELGSYVKKDSEQVIPTLKASLLGLTHVYVDGHRIDESDTEASDETLDNNDSVTSNIAEPDHIETTVTNDEIEPAVTRDYWPIAAWIESTVELDEIALDPTDEHLGLQILYLTESGYATEDSLNWSVPSQAVA